MCKNLVEKGHLSSPLLLYNRTAERAADLAKKLPAGKARVVESLADGTAQADIIFTCLSDDAAVQDTYEAILQGDVKGKLMIECSTIHPDTTEAVAQSANDCGADFVAAPVFGMPAAAEAGQLIAVLAGPRASVDKARPWFNGVMARAEIDLGDQPYGKATTLKVLGNTFILNLIEQLAEAYTVSEKIGLGTDPLKQLVDMLLGGPYSGYTTRMLTGQYHQMKEPLFAAHLAAKDARHALSVAQAAGARMATVEHALHQLDKVQKHSSQMGRVGDISGLYGAARHDAGLSFENASVQPHGN